MSNDKDKLKKYEKALKILLDDSLVNDIIDKKENNKEGEEDCIIIDYAKDINELGKEEYTSLKKQDEYRRYDKIKKYAKQGSVFYGVGNTILGIGSMMWLI